MRIYIKVIGFSIIILLVALFIFFVNVNKGYRNIKTINSEYTSLIFSLYVDHYFNFPSSEEQFKKFYINAVFDMGQKIEFVLKNPLLENSLQFTQYKDADGTSRIRATLSKKAKTKDNLIHQSVPLEEYKFMQYLTNSRAVLLFDYPARRCGGTRHLRIFNGIEPDKCFDEQEVVITKKLKQFYKNRYELVELLSGSSSACYSIEANRIDSTFHFAIDCYPQDSMWIDEQGLSQLLDTLTKSFNTPELKYVNHFYFPLIVKNTTLQQETTTNRTND